MRSEDTIEHADTIIHSWDFDGMLASMEYTNKLQELIIKAAKEGRSLTMDDYRALADHILDLYGEEFFDQRLTGKFASAKHIIYVGSDRQDRHTDRMNGTLKDKGGVKTITLSAYPFYHALAERIKERYEVNVELDKFLLEDLYQGFRPGTTFDDEMNAYLNLSPELIRAIAESLNTDAAADIEFPNVTKMLVEELSALRRLPEPIQPVYIDKLKFMVLYAQMHYGKMLHARDASSLLFRYADDRRDILTEAGQAYTANPWLLPPDTKLCIEQFLPPDSEYRQTPKHQRQEHHERLFGPTDTTEISSAGTDAVIDYNALETIGKLHVFLQKHFDTDINKDTMSKMTADLRSETTVKANQEKAIRLIQAALNEMDKKAKGVIQMNKIIAAPDTAESKLTQLQEIAKVRLGKSHMTSKSSSGFLSTLKSKRSDAAQTLYETLRDMDIKNPDLAALDALTNKPHVVSRKGIDMP